LPKYFLIVVVLMLSACDHFEADAEVAQAQIEADAEQAQANVESKAERVVNNVRDSIKRTNNRVRNWWLTPLPVEEAHVMPPRYCYRVLQDILCYRQPRTGWESRLVGYQGDNAPPPPAGVTVVTPLRPHNPDATPAKRAENAKPVFAKIPEDNKENKDNKTAVPDVTNLDAAHGTITDSVNSPQL
jgi:hypothetical protein